jgi:hypothetical protein
MSTEDNDISKLFSTKLKLHDKNVKTESAYQRELDKTQFKIFETVSDHGYYTWMSKGNYIHMNNVKACHVKNFVDLTGKPEKILSMLQLQKKLGNTHQFKSLPPLVRQNRFPFGKEGIGYLYVASVHRKVELTNLDFVFGGSALQMLAMKEDDPNSPYYVTVIPGTDVAMVTNGKRYEINASDVGYQFERFVTGKSLQASSADFHTTEHLHVMNVGDHKVLFCCEVDAIDDNDELVELTCSNPRYWGTRQMFQMISSGSTKFFTGKKEYGMTLVSVNCLSLSRFVANSLINQNVRALEDAILSGMQSIKDELALKYPKEGNVFRISFHQNKLKLKNATLEVLPPAEVVRALLQTGKEEKETKSTPSVE